MDVKVFMLKSGIELISYADYDEANCLWKLDKPLRQVLIPVPTQQGVAMVAQLTPFATAGHLPFITLRDEEAWVYEPLQEAKSAYVQRVSGLVLPS